MIFHLLAYVVEAYVLLLIVRALLSWFPAGQRGGALDNFQHVLFVATEPVLRPIRRVVPPLGGGSMQIDLSIIIAILVAQIVLLPLLRS